jgi:hypothetical protein
MNLRTLREQADYVIRGLRARDEDTEIIRAYVAALEAERLRLTSLGAKKLAADLKNAETKLASRLAHSEKQAVTIRKLKAKLDRYPDLWKLECGHFAQVTKWNVPDYVCGHCQALARVAELQGQLDLLGGNE